jgi:hypothetical protein
MQSYKQNFGDSIACGVPRTDFIVLPECGTFKLSGCILNGARLFRMVLCEEKSLRPDWKTQWAVIQLMSSRQGAVL